MYYAINIEKYFILLFYAINIENQFIVISFTLPNFHIT